MNGWLPSSLRVRGDQWQVETATAGPVCGLPVGVGSDSEVRGAAVRLARCCRLDAKAVADWQIVTRMTRKLRVLSASELPRLRSRDRELAVAAGPQLLIETRPSELCDGMMARPLLWQEYGPRTLPRR